MPRRVSVYKLPNAVPLAVPWRLNTQKRCSPLAATPLTWIFQGRFLGSSDVSTGITSRPVIGGKNASMLL